MGFFDKFGKKKGGPSDAGGARGKKSAAPAPAAAETPVKEAEAKRQTRGPLARDGAGNAYRILLEPIFTEKGAALQAGGKYAFFVAPNAGKVEIAVAVRDLYGIKPTSVRIVNVRGKKVRFGRFVGRQKDRKKAIVTLPAGQSITMFEGA